MFELVLGTHNHKKRDELRTLLPEGRIELLSLDAFPDAIEVVEDGETFERNAAKKATEQAKHLGRWVLAEDSGLSVDALGGAPGVHSARFAGRHGDDEANNDKLLEALGGVPEERRGAHYTCHLCLSDPRGNVREQAEGICRGRIAPGRAGSAGFGYDPLFVIPEYHRTFGELGSTVKQALSHRSRALRALIPNLLRLIERETPK
jgi:XTP/dITP diphosphohydrolase